MTDQLRQAAQQALENLGQLEDLMEKSITDLKAALEQQAEPTIWRDMVVVSLVREGINKHKARELADHFANPPQRPWVGLTDEDVNRESAMIAQKMKLAFHAGLYVAQEILRKKNDSTY